MAARGAGRNRPSLRQLYGGHRGKVSDKWLSYLREYDRVLGPYRRQPVRLLEVGVQNGGSLEIWSKYFANARKIVGCDIDPACGELEFDDPRIAVVVGDVNSDDTHAAIVRHARRFEIVIDDGSHRSSDVIETFTRYFPLLVHGGTYVVEDIHSSYWRAFGGGLYAPFSAVSFFKRLADIVNHEHWGVDTTPTDVLHGFISDLEIELSQEALEAVHSVEFANSLCIVRKERPLRNRLGQRFIAGSLAPVEPEVQSWHAQPPDRADEAENEWSRRSMPPEEELPLRLRELADRSREVGSMAATLQERDRQLTDHGRQLKDLAAALEQRDQQLADSGRQVERLTAELNDGQRQTALLNQALSERDAQISQQALQIGALEQELGDLYKSRSWRLAAPLRRLRLAGSRFVGRLRLAKVLVGLGVRRGPRHALRTYWDQRLILHSGAFDADYYGRAYPDVTAAAMDAALHYVLHGAGEGRNPNRLFSTKWYVSSNPDVASSGLNPLAHYIRHGAAEGRDPSPTFSTLAYLEANPDVAAAGVNPLVHYLRFGLAEGRPLRPSGPAAHCELSAPSKRLRSRTAAVARRAFELLPLPRDVKLRLKGQLRHLAAADAPGTLSYADWIDRNDTLGDHDRALIRAHIAGMTAKPTFSIVMPVFNTPAKQLREAIDSVIGQLYEDWELCIADDGSTKPHVRQILRERAQRDGRIRLVLRPTNGGISAATNSALETATGDWIVLMDHDDLLAEHALYMVAAEIERHPAAAVIYSDEDHIDEHGQRSNPYFKPDWDYDLLLGQNVISHLGAYRADVARVAGGFRGGYEGSQDWDFVLRVIEAAQGAAIRHIPFVLYHWRQSASTFSTVALEKAVDAARRAVSEHLERSGQAASVVPEGHSSYLKVRRELAAPLPAVSIVVPTKDRPELLRTCIDGLLNRTDYEPLEVVIVDNGSTDPAALAFLEAVAADPRVKVIREPGQFNFSRLVNRGVAESSGDIIVLLNNDIDVIERGWLREMVSHTVRPDVGVVGAKLYYADDTIQHAGTILGLGGIAGHAHRGVARSSPGYFGNLNLLRNVSAVTAACWTMRRDVYSEVGPFNESGLAVAFNDVDFCLRVREAGYRVIWTPRAELYHYESVSRGYETTPEKQARFRAECDYMRRVWQEQLDGDPFYNPNLSLVQSYRLADAPRASKPWMSTLAVGGDPDGRAQEASIAVSTSTPLPKYVVRALRQTNHYQTFRYVVLVGHSAAGKSRLARLAGLDRDRADFDRYAMSHTGPRLEVFADFVRSPYPFVVAPNDRSVLRDLATRKDDVYRDIAVVYLHRPREIVRSNLQTTNEDGLTHAPMSEATFTEYYSAYESLYTAAADYVFEYDGPHIDDVLHVIQALVSELKRSSDLDSRFRRDDKLNLFGDYVSLRESTMDGRVQLRIPSVEDMARLTAGGYQAFDTSGFPPRALAGSTADLKLRDLRWTDADFAGMAVTEVGAQLGFFSFVAAALGARSVIGFDANPEFVEVANSIAVHYRTLCGWPDDKVMFRTGTLRLGDAIEGRAEIIIANSVVHWFIIQERRATVEDILAWLRDNASHAVYFEGCVTAAEPVMRDHGITLDRYNEDLFLAACRKVFKNPVLVGRCSYNPRRIVMRLYSS